MSASILPCVVGASLNLQVTSLPRTAAVTLCRGQVAQTRSPTPDPRLVRKNDSHGIVLGPLDLGLSPARGSSRVSVLDQQVRGSYLALGALTECIGPKVR